MNPFRDYAARLCVELEVEDREEAALAVEHRLDESAHRAALIEIALRPQLHSRVELQRQIGMLGDDVARLRRHLPVGLSSGVVANGGGFSAVANVEAATWPQTAWMIDRIFCWNAVARAASICSTARL